MAIACPRTGPRVPVLLGSDVELANFVLGLKTSRRTGAWAARALLAEVPGIPHAAWTPAAAAGPRRQAAVYAAAPSVQPGTGSSRPVAGHAACDDNLQDWGRKFLPANGGCAYIDLDHLELPIPEVLSAYDYVAAWHAMLRLARNATDAANGRLPAGLRLQVLANNSDGFGNSYGSHMNVLIPRRTFDNIFRYRLHYLLYLASYQVSSIVFTGQGKVGAENGAPDVAFQISQRADFFETLTGTQTTHHRPIVNSRDEPLCGGRATAAGVGDTGTLARLHVIFYDSNLCHEACLLKAGVLQLIVALLAADQVNPDLLIDDPVATVVRWSHDPTLRAEAALVSGKRLTAVDLQSRFLDEVRAFHQRGGFDAVVPHASAIIRRWGAILERLRAGDLDGLAGSVDWILKRRSLERVMVRHPQIGWNDPKIKHLDHLYSSLDPAEGLYWAYEQAGVARRVVTDRQIDAFLHAPPEDTRAWCRALLLRLAGRERIDHVDWDAIRFKQTDARGWTTYRTLTMPNPLRMTKAEAACAFQRGRTLDEVLDELIDLQAAVEPASPRRPPSHWTARGG